MSRDKEIQIDDKPQSKAKSTGQKWLQAIRFVVNGFVLIVNVLAALGLLASAYAEHIAPSTWALASAVVMTLGWWLLGCVVLFVIDLLWWRRTAWVQGIAMLLCLGTIHDYSPLNIPNWRMNKEEKERSFTLMTYNAFRFQEFDKRQVKENRQIDFILRHKPDIVCIQETDFLAPTEKNCMTQRQIDSLHITYPYIMTQGQDFALLSKFEAQPININFPTDSFASGGMAAWRVHIEGRVLNIFSVHLRSFGLTEHDKGKYQEIVKLDSINRQELRQARAEILPKIKGAAVEREGQIRYLEKYLAKYGGVNAIVCGDFNDPVGCYPLYSLEQTSHLQQAYAQVGFGPAITYHADFLYFRIDHILYRGNLRPWKISRGSIDASDHYPLLSTFIFDY